MCRVVALKRLKTVGNHKTLTPKRARGSNNRDLTRKKFVF